MPLVDLSYGYYPDPTRGRPVFNGSIFIGDAQTDPEVLGNQKQVTIIQEDGTEVQIAQPIKTGAGGVPEFNGSPIKISVSLPYSLKVLDKNNSQVYFDPEAGVETGIISLRDHGGVGDDGVTDDTAAILDLVELVKSINGTMVIDAGFLFRYTSKILIDAPCSIIGEYNGVHNVGERFGSGLLKDGSFDAIEVTNSAGPSFKDFYIEGAAGNGGGGILLTQCGRARLSGLSVVSCSGDGIRYVDGDLSSFRDLYLLGNTTGFRAIGAATPNNNAAIFSNIDARGNTGDGVVFDACWNAIGSLTSQNNGGRGFLFNNFRGSNVSIYAEANTGVDVEFGSSTNFEGNIINILFPGSTITDNSVKPEDNQIVRHVEGSDTRVVSSILNTKILAHPFTAGIAGSFFSKHDIDTITDFYADDASEAQFLRFKNVADLSDVDADDAVHPLYVENNGGSYSNEKTFVNLDTSPDVSLSEFWIADNSSATTITDFNGTCPIGKEITVYFNNGNTTLTHTSPVSSEGLVLLGAANKTFARGDIATFIKKGTFPDWWVQTGGTV